MICIIIDSILGAATLLAIIMTIIFPGLPYYIKPKLTYKNIDKIMLDFEHYDINESENARLITVGNINMYIPNNCEIIEETNSGIVYNDAETGYCATIFKSAYDTSIEHSEEYNLIDVYNSLGLYPENGFEFYKMFFSFNSKNFDLTDKENSAMCMTLANEKEIMYPLGQAFIYESNDLKGFVWEYDNGISFQFYDADDLNNQYQVFFSFANDNSLVYSSINSITITDNKQNP